MYLIDFAYIKYWGGGPWWWWASTLKVAIKIVSFQSNINLTLHKAQTELDQFYQNTCNALQCK
jgi:hypothetical protein